MSATPAKAARNPAIDRLRGLVMVLMVLDHTRDFFRGFRFNPTNLQTTTPLFFMTRWVTHFCAPVFVFLAGTAAFLYGRSHTQKEQFRFLLTRGLFLVVLELTVVRLGWVPDPFYRFTLVQVIWAIGWSMVFLALVSRLPVAVVAGIGLAIVLGHNALDGVHGGPLWRVFHERTLLEPWRGHKFMMAYPLLPWFGVICVGYGFGPMALSISPDRRRNILLLGAAITVLFEIMRLVNRYGDPHPWHAQRDAVFTFLSFLDCTKYPPSLLYLAMTLGPALMLLVLFERGQNWALSALATFGRVPLFFYVAHLYGLRIVSGVLGYQRWGMKGFEPPPTGHGGSPEYPLWATYVVWVLAICALYPACRWFAGVKQRSRSPILAYL